MPTLEGLRRQIDTATDISSVVTTMKTLAAVSIHQYEQAAEALVDYARTIELGFQIALREHQLPVDEDRPAGRTAAIVFGSDQGMCGQFNERIVEFVGQDARRRGGYHQWRILAVGSRGESQLRDAGWSVDSTYAVPSSVSDITNLVQEILPHVQQLRETDGLTALWVFHNRRVSGSSFEPSGKLLLPPDPERLKRLQQRPWSSRSLPTFAESPSQLLAELVQHDLFASLFQACAESLASENASRIAAMQAAEKNIEERLTELHGAFNQLRQSAITEELLDVVTGFEALSRQKPG